MTKIYLEDSIQIKIRVNKTSQEEIQKNQEEAH